MGNAAFDRKVLFFGGKGGVGKTTLAASVAMVSAEGGARTLLVSTDPAHSTSDVLGFPLGNEPSEVLSNLWAVEIDPAQEVDRYIEQVKTRIADSTPPRLAAEVERQIDIARVTPEPTNPPCSTVLRRSSPNLGRRMTASCSTRRRSVIRSGCCRCPNSWERGSTG